LLPQRDITSAIDSIYAAAVDPSHWPKALQAVADAFGDVGCILLYGKDDGSFGAIESVSLEAVVAEYARDGWSLRDTRAVRARERGFFFNRDVVTDRDVLTAAEIEADPFYSDLLARHGLMYFAAAMVTPDPRVEVTLSVQRRRGLPEYSDAELVLLSSLGKHVERSLRLGIRLMNAELANQGLRTALTRMGIGVFALDSLARVIFSNPAGDALLGDGLSMLDERLIIERSVIAGNGKEVHRQIVNYHDQHQMQRPILIHRRGSNRALILYVLPLSLSSDQAMQFLAQAHTLLLLIDPGDNAPPDPSIIRDVLGLTLGEARIASLVGSGFPPRAAAEKLGIAEETARSTLKRVFSKVGVARQSELAALMTRLVLR
jgi:DNA-binding CsgD family transcriptional regulator/PAS domain-containing protein